MGHGGSLLACSFAGRRAAAVVAEATGGRLSVRPLGGCGQGFAVRQAHECLVAGHQGIPMVALLSPKTQT